MTASIENDRATSRVHPRLGKWTAIWLGILFLGEIFLPGRPPIDGPANVVWLAAMWSGLSISVWLTVQGNTVNWRHLLLLISVAWHVFWMQEVTGRPLARYFLSMGSLVLLQFAFATVLGLTSWRITIFQPPGQETPPDRFFPGRRQFGITTLLVLTLLSAAWLAANKQFDSADWQDYGQITFLVANLILINFAVQRAFLGTTRGGAWQDALLLLVALGASLGGICVFASWLHEPPERPAVQIMMVNIYLLYAGAIAVTAFCGRADR